MINLYRKKGQSVVNQKTKIQHDIQRQLYRVELESKQNLWPEVLVKEIGQNVLGQKGYYTMNFLRLTNKLFWSHCNTIYEQRCILYRPSGNWYSRRFACKTCRFNNIYCWKRYNTRFSSKRGIRPAFLPNYLNSIFFPDQLPYGKDDSEQMKLLSHWHWQYNDCRT